VTTNINFRILPTNEMRIKQIMLLCANVTRGAR